MNKKISAKTKNLLEQSLFDLMKEANQLRRRFCGDEVDLCSILNAKSGLCHEDCKFCAQSRFHKTKVAVYSLKDKDEIVAAALTAQSIGAKRFGIVTSGNRLNKKEIELIAQAITEIKKKSDIVVCGSLGALTKESFMILKQAGLSRYHHNIETSPSFYSQIVSTHSFDERIATIRTAKELGLQVCSGGIIGLGESWQDRVDMADILKELEVDSVPLNFLVPIQGTPLAGTVSISCHDALRVISLFRIILEKPVIKIAAGRETVLQDFASMGFMAGANGMLIGGYLTVQGRDVGSDQRFVQQIKQLWNE